MESLHAPPNFMDDLLDFSSDIGEETDDNDNHHLHHHHHTKTLTLSFPLLLPPPQGEMVEEELEWISNKDAFPMVESLVDIIPNHHSPVSVLDTTTTPSSCNSNASRASGSSAGMASILSFPSGLKVPVKARTKKVMRRRELFDGQQWQCWAKETKKITKPRAGSTRPSSTLGRKCLHCQSEKTPQWRAGPMGPKTLCNACGVRYKSGRLLPEYRPACSPTFSSEVHSNSHRKVVEMRRQKQVDVSKA